MFTTQKTLSFFVRYKIISLLMAATIFCFVIGTTNAADQRAQIGKFTAEQTIKLALGRFQNEHSDGQPITDIRVSDHEGYSIVRRKRYSQDGNCIVEMTRILDSSGHPIKSGFKAQENTPVFLNHLVPMLITTCMEDNHKCSRSAEIIGHKGACDRTELSLDKCACHVTDLVGGIRIPGPTDSFCNSVIDQMMSNLDSWIRRRFILTPK